MTKHKSIFIAVLFGVPTMAAAQSLGDFVTTQPQGSTFLAVSEPANAIGGFCNGQTCLHPGQGISLENLGIALALPSLNSQVAVLNGQTAALASQIAAANSRIDGAFAAISNLNNQVAVINQRIAQLDALNNQITKGFELAAIAGAMRDAIPNPGDRFALRLNAAVFSGQAAGSIGFSYNLTDSARVSVNYGQARTQAAVSGGVNFSFR